MGEHEAGSWREFWNLRNRIYVDDRHLAAHCRRVADDILSLDPARDAAVLDYGCGEALDAGRVAARVGRLFLYDTAPEVRARLTRRFAATGNIAGLDEAGLERIPGAALDLIVVNSVLQYVSAEEFALLLPRWRGWLRPGGALVLADVIPPDDTILADVLALLHFARREGFFFAAVLGLAATFFSDYRALRRRLGLSRYGESDMLARLRSADFAAERRLPNFGINPKRMTFIARKSP